MEELRYKAMSLHGRDRRADCFGLLPPNPTDSVTWVIRDAEISGIVDGNEGMRHLCILTNSKNRLGGYTGRTYAMVTLMPGGAVKFHADSDAVAPCQGLSWRPFTEYQ
jgi:hypothetical protein